MVEMVLRCYTEPVASYKHRSRKNDEDYNPNVCLVLDTETRADNLILKFGSSLLYVNGQLIERHLFYNPDEIDASELKNLEIAASKHAAILMPVRQWVDEVFYNYALKKRAVIVGFNLKFDLSRLAIRCGVSRVLPGGFSFTLSETKYNPPLSIKHVDSNMTMFKFAKPPRHTLTRDKKRQAPNYTKPFDGAFVDCRTFGFALTDNKHLSLRKLCEMLDTPHKKIEDEQSFGYASLKHIDYNINDSLCTADCYFELLKRYSLYNLAIPPHRIYSPATLGKAFLRKMGIRSFFEQNPNFPKEIIGYLMTGYIGARVECRMRDKPTKATYLDYTSMYPSLYCMCNLDDYLKAEKIEHYVSTDEIKSLVESITLDDLQRLDIWHHMPCICLVRANDDVLPLRSNYQGKNVHIIGVNYLTTDFYDWWPLADVIASKLRTGRVPEIYKSISFRPVGRQHLKPISLLGLDIQPEDNIFKKLIEERQRIKRLSETPENKINEHIYKIIANSTSYGINLQVDSKEPGENEFDVDVYGLTTFRTRVKRLEKPGQYFNPVIGITITSGARLILSMVDAILAKYNEIPFYMDTDSVIVPPEREKEIQDFFQPLNPYNDSSIRMFKVEKSDDKKTELRNIWFYGLASKRYVVYDFDAKGQPRILKHSSHGIGENVKGLISDEVWRDVLKYHYEPDIEYLTAKYGNKAIVSDLTINTLSLMYRFKDWNKHNEHKFKPFDFVCIGVGEATNPTTGQKVIPVISFTNTINNVANSPFIDYRNGMICKGDPKYWRPQLKWFMRYANHHDNKMDGKTGRLELKRLTVHANEITYIGKESNNIESQLSQGVTDEDDYLTIYQNPEVNKQNFLDSSPSEHKGISRRQHYRIKQKIIEGREIKTNKATQKITGLLA